MQTSCRARASPAPWPQTGAETDRNRGKADDRRAEINIQRLNADSVTNGWETDGAGIEGTGITGWVVTEQGQACDVFLVIRHSQ